MALNRRELLQAGAVAGLSTVFASQWALGAANDAVTGAGAWLPPAAGTYPLLQGDDLDTGAYVVEDAVASGGALRQLTRHVFDNGCVEEQLSVWDANGVRIERLGVSFFGVGDVLTFEPAAQVAAFAGGASRWTSDGVANGTPYAMTVSQRSAAGQLDVHRRLELRSASGLTVVEQRVTLSPAHRVPVRGSTVVLAEDAESFEWTLSG